MDEFESCLGRVILLAVVAVGLYALVWSTLTWIYD